MWQWCQSLNFRREFRLVFFFACACQINHGQLAQIHMGHDVCSPVSLMHHDLRSVKSTEICEAVAAVMAVIPRMIINSRCSGRCNSIEDHFHEGQQRNIDMCTVVQRIVHMDASILSKNSNHELCSHSMSRHSSQKSSLKNSMASGACNLLRCGQKKHEQINMCERSLGLWLEITSLGWTCCFRLRGMLNVCLKILKWKRRLLYQTLGLTKCMHASAASGHKKSARRKFYQVCQHCGRWRQWYHHVIFLMFWK